VTALSDSEIQPGIVAYLEERVLRLSVSVEWFNGRGSRHGPPERRPFLCVLRADDFCRWLPVTTEAVSGSGYKRLPLKAVWKSGGDQNCYGNQWIALAQYLVDGANIYQGPVAEFARASANECTTPASRSLLNQDGVDAVNQQVEKQKRRRTSAK